MYYTLMCYYYRTRRDEVEAKWLLSVHHYYYYYHRLAFCGVQYGLAAAAMTTGVAYVSLSLSHTNTHAQRIHCGAHR